MSQTSTQTNTTTQNNVASLTHLDMGMPIFGIGEPRVRLDQEGEFHFLPVDFRLKSFAVPTSWLSERSSVSNPLRSSDKTGMVQEVSNRLILSDMLLFGWPKEPKWLMSGSKTGFFPEISSFSFKNRAESLLDEGDEETSKACEGKEMQRVLIHTLQPLLTVFSEKFAIEERIGVTGEKACTEVLLTCGSESTFFAHLLMESLALHIVPYTDPVSGGVSALSQYACAGLRKYLIQFIYSLLRESENLEAKPRLDKTFGIQVSVDWSLFRKSDFEG